MDEGDIKKVEDLAEKIAKQRETVYHEQVRLVLNIFPVFFLIGNYQTFYLTNC